MEQLLHYVWKHRLFPPHDLLTTDGLPVEVIDSGLHNHDAGPDFFNAKVKIDGTLWVGNVEIHERASDWLAHHHDSDPRYDNVVLHVVGQSDTTIDRHGERGLLPQLQLDIPQQVRDHYDELLRTDHYPPCHRIIPELSKLTVHAWMAALQTERLEQKTALIAQRAEQQDGSWEAAYFATLARNYGFGVNGDAFEEWARHIPLQQAAHHRDDPFQIEALFMGQAGLLDPSATPPRHRETAAEEGYLARLQGEYAYLSRKFGLQPMDYRLWKFLRLRPQNFPHIRIAQLVRLYCEHRSGLSQLLDCTSVKAAAQLMETGVTPYWETHYGFGSASEASKKMLSPASTALILINTAIPMLFAYGRHKNDETLCQRAFDFLEQLKAEDNHIVRMWRQCGLPVDNAGDSQALIQLKKAYCDRRECLRCRIGYHYLSRREQFLR